VPGHNCHSCARTDQPRRPPEVASAALYVPPRLKRIAEPRFCFTPAERARTLQAYRRDGADTLFELVADQRGEVQKARLIRSHVRREYHDEMKAHARRFVSTPDARARPTAPSTSRSATVDETGFEQQ